MSVPSSIQVEKPSDAIRRRQTVRGRWQLAAVLIVVGVLWGIVFPAISDTEAHKDRVRRMEESGIDPMALFYTDHSGSPEMSWDVD